MAKKVCRVEEEYYHGVREVYFGEERVVLLGSFGITVPGGYAYCANPDEISPGWFGTNYLMRIVPIEYSDSVLTMAYGIADVTFNLFDSVRPIWPAKKDSESDFFKATDIVDFINLDNQGYNLPKGNYETVTQNADIWVRYSPDDCNETGEWVSCPFEIIVRDANALFGGQIQVNKDEIPDWESKVQEILGWIDASIEGVDDEHPFLYDEWLFNGFSGEYDIQNGIKIPVPVGCESEENYTAGLAAKWRFNDDGLPLHYGLLYLQDNIEYSYASDYIKCYTYANRVSRESSFIFTGKLNSLQASFFGVPSVSMFDSDDERGAGMGGSTGILVFSKQGISILHVDLRIPTPNPRPTFSSMLYDLIRIAKAFAEEILVDGEQCGVQLNKNSGKTTKTTLPKGEQLTLDDCYIDDDVCGGIRDDDKTAVILPTGIKIIESGFSCSDDLSLIVIPEGVTEIQENAFANCEKLKTVILPDTVQIIGEAAFHGTAVETIRIPIGCEEIGGICFRCCKSLIDVFIPGSVKVIGDEAFKTYNSNTVIHTEKGSAAEKYAKDNGMKFDYDCGMNPSKDGSAMSKEQNRSGKTPKNTIPKGERLTLDDCDMIGDCFYGFCGDDERKAVILPEGIKKIGITCCNSLCSIVIPEGVDEIEESAFSNLENLNTVVLPSSIRIIGGLAFSFTALKTITIPRGCEEIGEECFLWCDSLTDVCVPASVKTIGEGAFDTRNEKTVIHTEKGSAAEKYAKDNGMKYDYNYAVS